MSAEPMMGEQSANEQNLRGLCDVLSVSTGWSGRQRCPSLAR